MTDPLTFEDWDAAFPGGLGEPPKTSVAHDVSRVVPIDRPRPYVAAEGRDSPTESRPAIPYRTPLEVAASTSEEPDWLVRGYLALGAITEIDGKIKSSGKTTLVTHLVASILDGQPFLGQPTMKTNVVYLTEQTPGPFREALQRANLLGRGSELRIVFRADVAALPWPELIRKVTEDATRDGYGLLVIDTLGKLAQVREENDAGEGGRVMAPLQDAAHRGIGVIVCRHERKGGGEVGESGRGSSAISGDVDVILQLRRPEGNQPSGRRVIETLSRYTETPEKVVIELREEGYVLLGNAEAVSAADAERFVFLSLSEVFDRNESEGLTRDELVSLGQDAESVVSEPSIRRALSRMMGDDVVLRSGAGKKNDPYRYRLSERSFLQEKRFLSNHGVSGQERSGEAA